ncbi:hypothetical protein [Streptomyces sp. NBC_00385]|uniref:hypothetical protein n=1 Tax=Streptomyces sp. NBC_00385 TaxID=2975733 RepID=UPI002DD7FBE8|nr:hypothetical protein [Streptomyces sp. NBC_00385]WRZ06467.1 hypothetical protein OG959_25555 [Streptomyces sp. NBC_00385]
MGQSGGSERPYLEALAAALDAYEPPTAEWTDELWELYEHADAEERVLRAKPDDWSDDLWEQYRSTEVPEPHPPLTQEQEHLFAQERDRERRISAVQHLLESLNERLGATGLRETEWAAALAERWLGLNLYASPAARLLHGLGTPHGEAALLRLVADDTLDREDRQTVREWLMKLRKPRNHALGRQPQEGETPLLPPEVRSPADAWGMDGRWPQVAMNRENATAVRAALQALLPARRPAAPEPPPEMVTLGDEEPEAAPDWVRVRMLLRDLMPHPRTVTRERMAEVRREAARMALEADGDFAERWTTRIGAWLAGSMFSWLCDARREPVDLAPWAVDLAEQYVLRGFAAEDAERFLALSGDIDPRSVAALRRLKEAGAI